MLKRGKPPKRSTKRIKRSPIKFKPDYYKTKAKALWQELIHIQWDHRCAKCGKPLRYKEDGVTEGTGHHLIKKRVRHLEFRPENGMLLCNHCHNHAEDAPHNHSPELFEKFLEEDYPEIYAWVEEHRYEDGKKPDYQEVCIELKELLKGA